MQFKQLPIETRKAKVKAMTDRMAQAYGVKKSDLPQHLGCSKSVVNNWAYYGRIPFDYLEACQASTGVSIDWLLFGRQFPRMLDKGEIKGLSHVLNQLLNDGIEYGLISEQHQGALDQLVDKFGKDLKRRKVKAPKED